MDGWNAHGGVSVRIGEEVAEPYLDSVVVCHP
jgi:hypothetical protein